jgi:tetratricopeptide (TPR) repeat protein
MQPVRHAYGALLLDAGRLNEAEQAYREDLERFADNVWSLHGLAECLRRQGRPNEALLVEEQFRNASGHADVAIQASCFCGAD